MTQEDQKKKKKKKKKNSGGSKAPLIMIIILIIGGVAASNFVGPKKGWMTGEAKDTKVANGDVSSGEDTTGETSGESDSSTSDNDNDPANTQETPTTAKVKPLSGIEKIHAGFIDDYLKNKARKYDPKKEYPIVTPNNTYQAFITDVDEEKMLLHIRQNKFNLKSSIHYSMLQPKVRYFFFHKIAARAWADRELEKYLKEKNAIQMIPDEPEVASSDSNTSDPKSPTAKPVIRYTKKLNKYDVSVSDSSPRLAHAALEVNNYLKNQVRIGKKRDGYEFAKVSDCHAKQHGSKAVFYLYVNTPFAKTSKEYKYQMVDGIRRFWALRCMSNGVAVGSSSLLCVVHNGKEIGGSKLDNAEEIYIR